jgi:cytoskeleton protein RodZ
MRARIDISEIESETKIRAKYLRALENEEWGLLPGPAYVRSFLRTYAEALGLDAKLLLEEYKLRHERPSDHDLMPIGAPRRRGRGGGGGGLGPARQRPPRGMPRWLVVGLMVVGVLIALFALGKSGNDGGGSGSPGRTDTVSTTTVPGRRTSTTGATASRPSTTKQKTKHKASSKLVRLQIIPTGPVYVCLRAAGGQMRLPGVTLRAGATSGTYRSSQFDLRLGNGNASLRVNGRSHRVANASPVGYIIKKGSVRRVPLSETPSC